MVAVPRRKFPLLSIPAELTHQILRKMEGSSFIPIYRTCTHMASMVETALKSIKYKGLTIAELENIHLKENVVEIEYLTERRRTWCMIGTEIATLSVNVLNSYIWKFVTYQFIYLENDNTVAKYLEKMRDREYYICIVYADKCSISHVSTAVKIFNPMTVEITSYTGDHHEILSALPIKTWMEHDRGHVIFERSQKVQFKNASEHLGKGIQVLGVRTYSGIPTEFFDLKASCGNSFVLRISDNVISF